MKKPGIITLTTDFGYEGGFAATLKGVILSINPNVRIVDITHQIAPQDIFQAAFTLLVNYRYFPKNTIHVVVVDPGVGSKRRILCAKTKRGTFVGPDNGVFSPILDREKKVQVYELNNPDFFLSEVSHTFHGRDKMAPAAAHLSLGRSIEKSGPQLERWTRIGFDLPKIEKNKIIGKIISVDRFGNLITNITAGDVNRLGSDDQLLVRIKGHLIPRLVRYFGEVSRGKLLAQIGSSSFLEVAQNMGSAAHKLKAGIGGVVSVERKCS